MTKLKDMPFQTAYGPKIRVNFDDEGLPSLTKPYFKDECDINMILAKYQNTGVVDHVRSSPGQFGDFSNIPDYQSAMNAVIHAQSEFESLPAKIRDRFQNDPAQFLAFVNDENNRDEAVRLGLIEPKIEPIVPVSDSQRADEAE